MALNYICIYNNDRMTKLRWLAVLMGIVMLAVAGFQVYWLKDNYDREKKAVDIKTNALFLETVRQVQDSLLEGKLWVVLSDTGSMKRKRVKNLPPSFDSHLKSQSQSARVLRLISQGLLKDSVTEMNTKDKTVLISVNEGVHHRDSLDRIRVIVDSGQPGDDNHEEVVSRKEGIQPKQGGIDSLKWKEKLPGKGLLSISETVSMDSNEAGLSRVNTIFINNDKGDLFKIKIDSLFKDTIPLPVLDSAFRRVLDREKLDLPFAIVRQQENPRKGEFFDRTVFDNLSGYNLKLGSSFPYVIKEISLPILFSVFLVGITVFSFVLLYRALLKQYRLSQMKNDLISNITHELKTPIATVGVAIEALKNFNAMNDPRRSQEYLDISQIELQRLELLVDKVLKLSMFERKELEVTYEQFDLKEVVNEVVASLRLQIEKINAKVTMDADGNTTLKADRLHLLSVVFNLLDNALKYNKGDAAIQFSVKEAPANVILKITDNGIGIPAAYKEKIFEKFFRVPVGDTHNVKGHGLGLSYVGQVVRQHGGQIGVESHQGIGSTFTITLPKDPEAPGRNRIL